MKRTTLLAIAFMATGALYAQKDSLNAVIQVENDYTPVVTKAAKKGFTPTTENSNNSTPLELEFSQKATPFEGFTGERDVKELLPKQSGNYPGYVRLGSGTGNNIDAKISYQYSLTEKDKFAAVASLEGFNSNIDGPTGKWDSRMYTSWGGVEYSHKFKDLLLKSNIELSNSTFNYNSIIPTDKQTVQKIQAGVRAVSALAGPFAYEAGVHFSRNHYKHTPFLWNLEEDVTGGFGENVIGADATLKYELTDNTLRNIVLGLSLNNYSYSKLEGFKNFAEINIAPAANFRTEIVNVRLGAQLNMITKNATFFSIAPDIELESTINNSLTLYTNIKGGRTASSFKALEQISPYWACDAQLKPAYTIADITTGARISEGAVSANIFIGYAYTKDDLLAMDIFSSGVASYITQENTSRIYIGGRAGYDYEGWLKTSAAAKYTRWNCDHDFLLQTKPELEVELNAEARLLDDIYVNATYSFATYADDAPSKNKNELNLRTSYKFADRFNAFVEGNNLLNREYIKYAGYYEQGINVLLGVSASF